MGAYQVQTLPKSKGVSFPTGHGAPLCLTTPGNADPCLYNFRPEDPKQLFQRLVSRSNQVWADAAAKNGALDTLHCVFGGGYLSDITDDLTGLRERGRYGVFRETAPPTVQLVTKLDDTPDGEQRARVDVVEHLSLATFESDATLVDERSGDTPHRYTFSQSYRNRNGEHPPPTCETGWVIIDDAT